MSPFKTNLFAARIGPPITVKALVGVAVALSTAIYSTSAFASCTTTSVGAVDTTLCVAGGPVTPPLNTGAGADIFTMTGGTLTSLRQGAASDIATISGGHIVGQFRDGDVFIFSGGRVGQVNLAFGSNSINMSGTALIDTTLNTENRTDSFTLSGGTIGGTVSTGSGNDTMTLSGTQIAGDVIFEGHDDVLILSGGAVAGSIFMDAGPGHNNGADGADTVTIMGGFNLAGFTGGIDGGDDVSSGDGLIDVLTYQGISGVANGATILNWETVVLDNATIVFGPTLVTGTDSGTGLYINGASVLGFAGGFALTGNLNNNATVSSQNGAVGDVIAVSGNYAGGGALHVDVDFAANTADTMTIAGNVSGGGTAIAVADVSSGIATGANIVVVDVAGVTAPGDFFLSSGSVVAGAFTYDLNQSGNRWVLSGTKNTVGSVYETAPLVLGALVDLPTMEQRVGHRIALPGDKAGSAVSTGAWLRYFGEQNDDIPTPGSSRRIVNGGVQAGYDFPMAALRSGQWVLGVYGQYGFSNAKINDSFGAGSISATGFGIGTTATWQGSNGIYADAQAQMNWITASYATGATNLATDTPAKGFALGIEVGKQFNLNNSDTLTPQAQLNWTRIQSAQFTDNNASTVILGQNDHMIGRLGLTYETLRFGRAGNREKIYISANILHDFSKLGAVTVAGTTLSQQPANTWAEFGIGASKAFGDNSLLYFEASYRRTAKQTTTVGFGVTAGLRASW